ncbi:hypothetical protein [Piscirickettsia salmonis]|uniref:hypothetical protein n=1 Tax=Piscirickettsia salmonis TaxID=1238 RepID=UPI0012B6EE15|nr:hypothetical protein [Piscirickettsia salmonis]
MARSERLHLSINLLFSTFLAEPKTQQIGFLLSLAVKLQPQFINKYQQIKLSTLIVKLLILKINLIKISYL